MFKPEVIVLDYETALLDGTPSVDMYRSDFRVISAAFAWRGADGNIKTRYLVGEEQIYGLLSSICNNGIPLVVHNFQFEYGVTKCRFPGMETSVAMDTMRLTQVADNGGREAQWSTGPMTYEQQLDALEEDEENEEEWERKQGLSLVAAASRWLPAQYQNHKEPFHALIRERTKCKQGQEGKNLNSLTPTELEKYNVADAEVTLALFEALVSDAKRKNYSWQLDHQLYVGSAKDIADSKIGGIPVNRELLISYKIDLEKELISINEQFRSKYEKEIRELETEATVSWINELKTEKGRIKREASITSEDFKFNVGSNKQLAALFVNKLKMTAKFTTKTGLPSFKSAFLNQWGTGGEILMKRRKRLLVLKQVESLLELSALDGKWHVDLKACGTTTGRFAGGRV